MAVPVEKSALDRRLDALEQRIAAAEAENEELHLELHRMFDVVRVALLVHNASLKDVYARLKAQASADELEALFNLPTLGDTNE
jgi:flagellar motility protein MotE (MotC chaperone)